MHIDYTTLLLAASWATAAFTLLCGVMAHAEVALRPLRLCKPRQPLLHHRHAAADPAGRPLRRPWHRPRQWLDPHRLGPAGRRVPPACRPHALALAGAGAGLVWIAACLVPAFMASRSLPLALASSLAALLGVAVARELGRSLDGMAGRAGPDLAGLRHPPGGAGRAAGRRRPVRAGGGPGDECAHHPGRDSGAVHLHPRAACRSDAPGGAPDHATLAAAHAETATSATCWRS